LEGSLVGGSPEEGDALVNHRRRTDERRALLDLSPDPDLRQAEAFGQIDRSIRPYVVALDVFVEHSHLGQHGQGLALFRAVV